MDKNKIFNEETLRQDIYDTWGENGAHAEVINKLLVKSVRPITEEEIMDILKKNLWTFSEQSKHKSSIMGKDKVVKEIKDRLQSDAVVFAMFIAKERWRYDEQNEVYVKHIWDEEFLHKTTQELYNSEEFKNYKNNLNK